MTLPSNFHYSGLIKGNPQLFSGIQMAQSSNSTSIQTRYPQQPFWKQSVSNENRINVIAAVIIRQGKVMLCQRPPHKHHGGQWEFPGGKFEPKETLSEAAARELMEELRLTVTNVGPTLFTYKAPCSQFAIHFTRVKAVGTPALIEHTDLTWADIPEFNQYDMPPADRAFCDQWVKNHHQLLKEDYENPIPGR
jgi:mutator protein MutT